MRLIPVVSLCVAFIGCSGSPTESLIAPTAARVASSDDGGATSSGAPTLTVDQSTLWVSCFNLPASRTVTTTSNFPGTITATVDNPYCSVTASQEATVTPGSGGAKHATFTISNIVSACNVTLTDKKGNQATVAVNVSWEGSCLI